MTALKEKTYCEVCGNKQLTPAMDLGPLPLPDQLLPIGSEEVAPKYPTEVLWCENCKTAHLRWVAPNKVVFPLEYHYRGANTKDVLSGMEGLVDAVEKHGLVHGLKVLDIGCNDGSLLDAFARRGAVCYGIEPTDAAKEAASKGHHINQVYLDPGEASCYVVRNGQPDLITFVNVFAHIEDFDSLMNSMFILLGPQTRLVIENHYLGSVLERKQFDTFYHEHPRTYSYTSFVHIAERLGMHVRWVEFPKRYGGNIRVFLYPGRRPRREPLIDAEVDFGAGLRRLGRQVDKWKLAKNDQIAEYEPIPAAAMPGRATILFNLLGLDAGAVFGVYEVSRSKKIGYYVPGTDIPIRSDEDFPWRTYTGPVLNMAWHIPDEIETNWRAKGFKGSFIQAVDPSDFDDAL